MWNQVFAGEVMLGILGVQCLGLEMRLRVGRNETVRKGKGRLARNQGVGSGGYSQGLGRMARNQGLGSQGYQGWGREEYQRWRRGSNQRPGDQGEGSGVDKGEQMGRKEWVRMGSKVKMGEGEPMGRKELGRMGNNERYERAKLTWSTLNTTPDERLSLVLCLSLSHTLCVRVPSL